jgi:hypothetical protein
MARAELNVDASRQDGFDRIAGASMSPPAPVAGASCLVTSGSIEHLPACRQSLKQKCSRVLRSFNERSMPDVAV